MDIEEVRIRFRAVRNSLRTDLREKWEGYQAKLLEIDPPPTPLEWLEQIQKVYDEQRLDDAIRAWQRLRMEDPQGFGEDIDPSTQVKGWGDDLPPAHKARLLQDQFHDDLMVQISYAEWMESKDW